MINNNKSLKGNRTGFSILEIIISISLFMIFVVTVLNIANYSFKQIIHSANIDQASILANESLEIIKNIRDADFSSLNNGEFGLSANAGKWALADSPDEVGIFERSVQIADFNNDQKFIFVTITWSDSVYDENIFSAQTYLTNWRGETNTEI
jgi:hypothetical protein